MADFIADFIITQSTSDCTQITITDESNYGANTNTNKDDFTDRFLTLTLADTLTPVVIPFPFLNIVDAVQDTIVFEIEKDSAFSLRLDVEQASPLPDDILFRESVVATTQFIENCKIATLNTLDLTNKKDKQKVLDLASVIIGETAALVRASRGDIVKAQEILDFTYNNCVCLNDC